MSDLREKVNEQITATHLTFDSRTDAIMALFAPYEKLVEAVQEWRRTGNTAEIIRALESFQPKRPRIKQLIFNGEDHVSPLIELTLEVKAALVAAGIIEE